MSRIDQTFQHLCASVLHDGVEYENKKRGVKRLQIPSYTFKHNFENGFPALSLKKIYWKGVVTELLWFLRGDNDVKFLNENGVTFWNKDAYNWYEKHTDDNPKLSFEEFSEIGVGSVGRNYSKQWTDYGRKDTNVRLTQPIPVLDKKYKPTYLGIACGKNKEGHFLSKTWEGMISRCYDKNNVSYYLYGGKGVYVCNKWLSFEGFLEDAVLLDGYDKKLANPKEFNLDKDGIGNGYIYSLDTCQWVSLAENSQLKSTKEYTLEKDGVKYTFTSLLGFCKEQNIKPDNIYNLWTSGAKKRQGFSLVSVKDLNAGFNQIQYVVSLMRKDIMSSQIICDAWNPSELGMTALNPCHRSFQIVGDVLKDGSFGFYLHWEQRSSDLYLGIPLNIASYALLAKILEKITGYKALGIEGNLKCVHFYDNQIEAAKELVRRDPTKYENCGVELPEIKDFNIDEIDTYINQLKIEDFKLIDYDSYENIKVEMLAPKSL